MSGDAGAAGAFDELSPGLLDADQHFGHRQHVRVTWLAVRRHGPRRAADVVATGLRRTARYAGSPPQYNETMSRAWVQLVAHHVAEAPEDEGFDGFEARNPALLDKRLLTRFYHPATLASPAARTGWVEPDRAPFPWQADGPAAAPPVGCRA